MTSAESLLDRLAPPGLLDAREKEYLINAGSALGVFIPAVAVSLTLSARTLRAALRSDPGLVRTLLVADVLIDVATVGYAVGRARQLKKTESSEETRERLAQSRPITWKTYARPVRDAVAVGLAASTTRSAPRAVVSGVLAYAFSVGMIHVARAVRPRMVRASELNAEFAAERRAAEEAAERGDKSPDAPAAEESVRDAIERLERIGGRVSEPRAYTPGPGVGDVPWTGMTDAPRDKVKAALERKLAEKERRAASGVDDIVE